MFVNSESDQQVEKDYDEEYKERDSSTSLEAEREQEESGFKQWFLSRKKKKADEESEAEIYTPTRFRSSKKKKKVEMFWVNLVFKIFIVGAVCFNFKFILNFMKDPISNFTHTLFVVGICVGINFIAVWILFYKSSFIRFYLSIFAILGSFGYYFYVNYPNHSFFGNNIITSVLVMVSALMVINPKVNYYLKSIVLLLIPVLGIYFSGNQFALVWTLLFNAGLILFFRVSKSKRSKSKKKEARSNRNEKQPA
ncbi:hypothetical protein COJ85_01830 [Bacillus sp. AFS076308]|uniref:hypothetical protein n=1 Tax=unclassified Bacillus (in: firmicutes) TaxID=185979 RepID=UPI000BF47848|nr:MULTISPECIES: hypothetical protein [unclassified Bacillus (in: firmicutes)]PFO09370.1 hypothetical protein COJ85_01830 [Bacillus sp. AFS076308]PGV50348.1 hypothetical protein COD92_18415 [Bacillus sp. AFS037270]